MPPILALSIWIFLLGALLYFDPAKDGKISPALWLPVVWMFILGSRLPSQWFGMEHGFSEEGNPFDRSIDLVLIVLAIAVLISRSFKWSSFFRRNAALTAYISFALLSVLWSDFPFVAFKRWFRDLGDYLMILVVLSDPRPLNAVCMLLRRLNYLLIPLSIVLSKYYPTVGKAYNSWNGMGTFVGAATGKNLLGLAAMLSGIFFFWDTLVRWPDRRKRKTRLIILINLAFLAMTIWLILKASSTTCYVCLPLGCMVIAAAQSKGFRRHLTLLKVLVPGTFCLYLILNFVLGMGGSMAQAVGKDPTLTDRTKIWAFVLGMHTNPLIGTGYESFWSTARSTYIWKNAGLGPINEAHNGYLEVYLNLGMIGLILLSIFVIASYRRICSRLSPYSNLASLSLAIWLIMLFWSVTEAGFRSGLMLAVFLLVAVDVPEPARKRVRSMAAIGSMKQFIQHQSPPLETIGQQR